MPHSELFFDGSGVLCPTDLSRNPLQVIIQAVCRGMRLGWVDIRTIYGVWEVSYFHPVRDSARDMRMVWHTWRPRWRRGGHSPG